MYVYHLWFSSLTAAIDITFSCRLTGNNSVVNIIRLYISHLSALFHKKLFPSLLSNHHGNIIHCHLCYTPSLWQHLLLLFTHAFSTHMLPLFCSGVPLTTTYIQNLVMWWAQTARKRKRLSHKTPIWKPVKTLQSRRGEHVHGSLSHHPAGRSYPKSCFCWP